VIESGNGELTQDVIAPNSVAAVSLTLSAPDLITGSGILGCNATSNGLFLKRMYRSPRLQQIIGG
jgi:hypothetical protein